MPPTEQEAVIQIALSDLIPTPDNPRKLNDDEAMRSLTASIKSLGVLQPVLCRPYQKKPGKYDLRAGHRRLHAAKAAGLMEIPAIVRDMDDKTAIEVTVTENLNREDLHPLDQGRAIKSLLAAGWDAAEVASRMGRTAGWVMRRAQLGNLSPKLVKMVEKPGHGMAKAHIGVLQQLARLPEKIQGEIAGDMPRGREYLPHWMISPADCSEFIQNVWLMGLDRVPWELGDPDLYPKAGACANCRKRSACQPQLWDDLETNKGESGRCLDSACFKEKNGRAMSAKLVAAKEKHGNVVLITNSNHGDAQAEAKRYGLPVLQSYSVRRCKKSARGAQPALIIAGKGAGSMTYINRLDSGASVSARAKPMTMKDKRAQLGRRRQAFVVDRMAGIVDEKLNELDGTPPDWLDKPFREHLAILHVAFAGSEPRDLPGTQLAWNDLDKYINQWPKMQPQLLTQTLDDLLTIWRSRLVRHDLTNLSNFKVDVERIAEYLDVDLKALAAEAITKLPEPKSWGSAKVNGNGKAAKPKRKAARKTKAKKSTAKGGNTLGRSKGRTRRATAAS